MYNAASLTSLYHDMDTKHSVASRLLSILCSCPRWRIKTAPVACLHLHTGRLLWIDSKLPCAATKKFYRDRGCDINPKCPRHLSNKIATVRIPKFFFLVREQLLQCHTSFHGYSHGHGVPPAASELLNITAVSHGHGQGHLHGHGALPATANFTSSLQPLTATVSDMAMDTDTVTDTVTVTATVTVTDTAKVRHQQIPSPHLGSLSRPRSRLQPQSRVSYATGNVPVNILSAATITAKTKVTVTAMATALAMASVSVFHQH